VITIDPPWAIGINVPYDTLTDSQLRSLDVASLQTDGYLLLWVTGRAMELGRRLLTAWGYTRASELVWIKLNLMQNLVRTGRTGHFLNHSKEHCLIGVKGDPPLGAEQHGFRRDCDVLVSELRESSRKPEEIYGVAQRLWPGARCLELFARQHNVGKPGWVAVGNQLDGSVVVDPELKRRLRERYPRVDFA
jgi:mRNA (2'-O-methyladenosine-N6-)-methyltransferase